MTPLQRQTKETLFALGQRVRMLREVAGLTQEEFSNRCDISTSFASLLERGERSPSFETLLAIARTVGVPLSDLFQNKTGEERVSVTPLLQFARDADMSAPDIERFIAVGRAMFGLKNTGPENGTMPCSIPNCGRNVLAKGVCVKHYHQERRAKLSAAP
jgi:transcriptional regulator with XRE-family HTH domain